MSILTKEERAEMREAIGIVPHLCVFTHEEMSAALDTIDALEKELRDAFRAAGVDDSISAADGIRSLVDNIEAFRAHAAESEREAEVFREELRVALRDHHTTSTERNDWKATAQSLAKTLEEVNEKYFDLLGDSEIPGLRSAARKLVRRALEVVR